MARRRWGDVSETLARMCDRDSALLLKQYGGRSIRIPLRIRSPRHAQTRHVVKALERQSYRQVAKATGLAPSSVWRESKREGD